MRIESKIGTVKQNDGKIFEFLTDFNNFKNLVPADQITNWESTPEQCTFEIGGMGKTGMRIIEKEPHKLLKIAAIEGSPFDFFLWIQLKQVEENNTKVKITMEPKINGMMQMMVKKPLKDFVDKLVDQMTSYEF